MKNDHDLVDDSSSEFPRYSPFKGLFEDMSFKEDDEIEICVAPENQEIKQFALFAGERYYPSGGWCDFKGTFDSKQDAAVYWLDKYSDDCSPWFHVIDLKTLIKVADGEWIDNKFVANGVDLIIHPYEGKR